MSLDVFSIKDYIKAGTSSVNVDEHYTFDELPLTEPSHVNATIKIHSAGVHVVGHFTAHSTNLVIAAISPMNAHSTMTLMKAMFSRNTQPTTPAASWNYNRSTSLKSWMKKPGWT